METAIEALERNSGNPGASDSSKDDNKCCGLCHGGGATGKWQVCRECRYKLIDKQARQEATVHLERCANCGGRRQVANAGVYCESCLRRFEFKRIKIQ